MTRLHHPSDEMLMAYGAGSLDEASAVLVASHLTYCPRCRSDVQRIERLGGLELEQLPVAAVADDALARVLARIDQTPLPPSPRPPVMASATGLPRPLAAYLPNGLEGVGWKRLGAGIEQTILLAKGAHKAKLLRVRPGVIIPEHGHSGDELTLVLQGCYQDRGQTYLKGDVAMVDSTVQHRPAAVGETLCLCLVVSTGPIKLSGVLGRLVAPFLDL